MERKNEAQVDYDLRNFIKDNRIFSKEWHFQKVENTYVQSILDVSSKKGTGEKGYPDLIYINEATKLLILVENKASTNNHISKNGNNPINFAVDGVKHYLSFFTKSSLLGFDTTIQNYFKNWKMIGIAFSGNINDEYNHQLDTFIIKKDNIENINEKGILNEEDYISYFENINLEQIATNISQSSKKINELLRGLDSQKRPILLSGLMICLYPDDKTKDFRNGFNSWETETIIQNIPTTIKNVLAEQGIPIEKIKVLTDELVFLNNDLDSNNTDVLKQILVELQSKVIPLFKEKSTYDIIGKFYEEFLRWAGIANVKKGIVLTPNHITDLFTELIDIKTNDVIFDPACGTGAFLISSMNQLIKSINNSKLPDKEERIKDIKKKQLIGVEKSSTMYSLAISNMLFRGDGKSQIFNEDFFSDKMREILKNTQEKPTIGFINPPYGGLENKKDPTKKEITFLERMLDNCSRFGIIIAPLSTYFKDEITRKRILSKHTLKYVINMPKELFQPNASTHTAVAVFETNKIHNYEEQKVIFYDLKDDGLILSKNKGRTDALNKWQPIKKDLLEKLKNPEKYNDFINLVFKTITNKDEWIIQAHAKTDYSNLTEKDFEKTIKEYVIFSTKLKLGLLGKKIDEITMLEILNENIALFNKSEKIKTRKLNGLVLGIINWKEFKIGELFSIKKGERLTQIDRIFGETPLITASAFNNGIRGLLDVEIFRDKKKLFKNKITIDMFGNVFFHNYSYFSDDNIHTLLSKEKENITIYIGLFISTILKKMSKKYGFGRQVRIERLKEEIIKFPIDKNGNPSWQFMENYIKSLPYSGNL